MKTLIIFIKYPEAGKVKTRLAKDVGDSEATRIYSQMTEIIIKRTLDPKNYNTIIFYDPPEKEEEVKEWVNNSELKYLPQFGNALGERISNAFKEVFISGAGKAVIIGSDCIYVDKETINKAMDSLDSTDIILGPAEDGGYYLMGTNKYVPQIFQDIQWSTDRVLQQTIDKINKNKLHYELLKTLKDIDTVDDLEEAKMDFADIAHTKP